MAPMIGVCQGVGRRIGHNFNQTPQQLSAFTYLFTDITMDGIFDSADLVQLLQSNKTAGSWADGDLNFDGIVSSLDLSIMMAW